MLPARIRAPLALVAFLSAGVALAQPDLAERALRSLDREDPDRWAFTQTMVENGTTTVARHDPTRPDDERWTLVSIDGKPPTDDERAAFAKRRAAEDDEKQDDDEESGSRELRLLITPGTLELIERTATEAVFSFEPTSENEDDREFNERLAGTLRVADPDGDPWVRSMEMRAEEPFSAAFGVKIKTFSLLMTYAPVGEEGAVLPRGVEIDLAGRAMLVKKIEERVEVRFNDYERVGG